MESWPPWHHKVPIQVPIQGQSMLPSPSMGSLLIVSLVTVIQNQQTRRHHSPTASGMQHCASQLIPIHRPLMEPGVFPCLLQGQRMNPCPLTSKTWALRSHQHHTAMRGCIDEVLSVCGQAFYSRGRQQQLQSPAKRGPILGEVHSRTPSRNPSRCVSPLLSSPYPQHRDECLHHSFSGLYLQPHQQEPLEEGVDLNWPETALVYTMGHSCSTQESTVECLPRSPMQKQVQFDLADDLDDAPQLCTDLAGFLTLPEDATNE